MSTNPSTSPEAVAARQSHDAAMAAKGAQMQISDHSREKDGLPPEVTNPLKDQVPAKFIDPATGQVNIIELAKAYRELESKQSQTKPNEQPPAQDPQGDPNGKPDEQKPQGSEQGKPDRAAAEAAAAEEYAKNGKLSDETYAALEAAGYSRAVVDTYIAGQKAIVSDIERQAFEVVGGKAAYEQMMQWGIANLSPAEQEAYDAAVNSLDPVKAKLAVEGLFARFRKEGSFEPSRTVGGQGGPVQGDMFRSKAEMIAAMSDPRYKTDAAYRQDVANKIAAAQRANINIFQ